MDLFKAQLPVNKETILSYISQEDIMKKYLQIDPNIEGMFCSPLRKDKHPTCTITWIDGKLLFRDWAQQYPLDCFGVVMEIYNLDFHQALKKIYHDFNIREFVEEGKAKRNIQFFTESRREKSIIQVKVQPFTDNNIDYVQQYYLNSDIINKFNVYSPKYVWLNKKLYYIQHDDDPALAYYFGLDDKGNQKWKIYFYKNRERRFITNTNRINGWVQIPQTADQLIITKSLKDVMCLDLFDIPSVAMQAESQMPYDYIIKELKDRFNNIITLFDYDEAGIRRATEIFDEYDIPYYFIQDPNAKDFSDYINYYGKDKAEQLKQSILNE